jgi:carbamoyl-phosphate synthase large subunit
MAGKKLEELVPAALLRRPFPMPSYSAVKEAVVPWIRFPGVDPKLGPEMKSTGEVMGIDSDFGRAFAKSQAAAGSRLPTSGTVFISVKDQDKPLLTPVARQLAEWGFKIIATKNTAEYLERWGVPVERVHKIGEGHPDVVELIRDGKVQLIINTPTGGQKAYLGTLEK